MNQTYPLICHSLDLCCVSCPPDLHRKSPVWVRKTYNGLSSCTSQSWEHAKTKILKLNKCNRSTKVMVCYRCVCDGLTNQTKKKLMHSKKQKMKNSKEVEIKRKNQRKHSYSGTMHRGSGWCCWAECVRAWSQAVSGFRHMTQRAHHWAEL